MTRDTDERGKLALADARDKAYERLHALAGSMATPPRWDDIATLLRERDELYQQLRSPAGHAEREAIAWQFRQRSGVGKGPQSQHAWCDWCSVEREDYEHYLRNPNPLVQVRALAALSNAPAPSEGVREEEFLKIAEPLFEAITRLNRCLADLGWKPSRAHIEGTRNTMQQVALAIGHFAAIHSSAAPVDTEDQGPDTLGERP